MEFDSTNILIPKIANPIPAKTNPGPDIRVLVNRLLRIKPAERPDVMVPENPKIRSLFIFYDEI